MSRETGNPGSAERLWPALNRREVVVSGTAASVMMAGRARLRPKPKPKPCRANLSFGPSS